MPGLEGFDSNRPNLEVMYTDSQTVKDTMKEGKAEVIVKLIDKTDDKSRQGHKVSYYKITLKDVTLENFDEKVNKEVIADMTRIAVLYKLGEENGAKHLDVNFDSLVIHKQDGATKERSLSHKLDKKSQLPLLNELLNKPETQTERPNIGERFKNKELVLEDFEYLTKKNPTIGKDFIKTYQGKDLQAKTDEWFLRQQKADNARSFILRSTNGASTKTKTTTESPIQTQAEVSTHKEEGSDVKEDRESISQSNQPINSTELERIDEANRQHEDVLVRIRALLAKGEDLDQGEKEELDNLYANLTEEQNLLLNNSDTQMIRKLLSS